jgi:hypothetical protein
VVTVTASMSSREQIVEVTYEDRIGGIVRCPPASRIVVPDCDELAVGVMVYLRGVLGLHVRARIPGPQR